MTAARPLRVMVLMGGGSSERNVSLATGRGVAGALVSSGYEVLAVDSRDGARLDLEGLAGQGIGEAPPGAESAVEASGAARGLALARTEALGECDVVFIALHGGVGEDGTLQALLDLAGVSYTGSGMLASALAMDKARAKIILAAAGVPGPEGFLLPNRNASFDAEALGGYPLVIKPNREGSSVGVHVVQEEAELEAALDDAFQYGEVLAERFIPGREVTVAVLGGEALAVVEIIPEQGFYDYRHKYTRGHTRYEAPANLPAATTEQLQELGRRAFAALGCRGVARVDFRLDPGMNPFCLEVNTVPGLTETSLVPMAAREAGMSYEALVRRLVELAGPAS